MTTPEKPVIEELSDILEARGLKLEMGNIRNQKPVLPPNPERLTLSIGTLKGLNGTLSVRKVTTLPEEPFPYLVQVVYQSRENYLIDLSIRPDGIYDISEPELYLKGTYQNAFEGIVDMLIGRPNG
jgi:hypothetical protein